MTTPDPSRQRVLDVARLSTPPASGYWGDVQDVCKIALEAMDERDELRAVIAKHDICHNLHGKVDARAFADGCAQEQRKLYGEAPDRDELIYLRAKLAAAEGRIGDHALASQWQGQDLTKARREILALEAKLAAQQPAADEALRKAAQAFADEPYQTDSARFHGLRNDLRAALAAAPAPRQDDALRELRAWLRPWPRHLEDGSVGKMGFYDSLCDKIDELLAAKPAPAEHDEKCMGRRSRP